MEEDFKIWTLKHFSKLFKGRNKNDLSKPLVLFDNFGKETVWNSWLLCWSMASLSVKHSEAKNCSNTPPHLIIRMNALCFGPSMWFFPKRDPWVLIALLYFIFLQNHTQGLLPDCIQVGTHVLIDLRIRHVGCHLPLLRLLQFFLNVFQNTISLFHESAYSNSIVTQSRPHFNLWPISSSFLWFFWVKNAYICLIMKNGKGLDIEEWRKKARLFTHWKQKVIDIEILYHENEKVKRHHGWLFQIFIYVPSWPEFWFIIRVFLVSQNESYIMLYLTISKKLRYFTE